VSFPRCPRRCPRYHAGPKKRDGPQTHILFSVRPPKKSAAGKAQCPAPANVCRQFPLLSRFSSVCRLRTLERCPAVTTQAKIEQERLTGSTRLKISIKLNPRCFPIAYSSDARLPDNSQTTPPATHRVYCWSKGVFRPPRWHTAQLPSREGTNAFGNEMRINKLNPPTWIQFTST
jgi:hypothetical protein